MKINFLMKHGFWYAWQIVASISILLTVWGISMKDFVSNSNICERVLITIVILLALSAIAGIVSHYYYYKNGINLKIKGNKIKICFGDIFSADGYRVIGFDTKFSTEVDDKIISKNSLHGQFILKQTDKSEFIRCISEASDETCENTGFETGTIIKFSKAQDDHTYLLLSLIKLNDKNEAHTNMAEFSQTMMRMWQGINSVYNGNDIAIPLLGKGITRFDDDSNSSLELLACMLYTLYRSKMSFNSTIKIILWKDSIDHVSLPQVRDIFKALKHIDA